MKSFDFKNVYKLLGFDLRNNRRKILGWSIAIFAIMFLYMILFSSMQEMAQIKLDAMPEELLQAFGLENMGELSNFISYFGMIFNLILIAISIFAASFASKLILGEEKTKSIEFLYSLEVSRKEIYVSKLFTAFIGVLIVTFAGIFASMICGFINGGDTFVIDEFMQISKISGFIPFFFMALAFMLTGITAKGGVGTISTMLVLVSYLLGYLSKLLSGKADWLAKLSPFEILSPENARALSDTTIIAFGVYALIFVVAMIVGAEVYKRRDFNL